MQSYLSFSVFLRNLKCSQSSLMILRLCECLLLCQIMFEVDNTLAYGFYFNFTNSSVLNFSHIAIFLFLSKFEMVVQFFIVLQHLKPTYILALQFYSQIYNISTNFSFRCQFQVLSSEIIIFLLISNFDFIFIFLLKFKSCLDSG